ncbi:MAG: glycosyltransferase family 4 protein [Thermoplasmata archaeon]|nr:glycosyltransferase family 4 protein [Thermoplasmata archaeon]
MRINFLGADVGSPTSGQSRFLINLSIGVRAVGHDVSVTASSVSEPARTRLEAAGVHVAQLGEVADRPVAQARLMTPRSRLGRRVASLAVQQFPSDWHVVLSDAIVDAVDNVPAGRSAYLCNGDLSLMFLSASFYRSHSASKRWLARAMATYIRQNAARARRYRLLLGNSEFTRNFMSYLYGVPFAGSVFPPVDLGRFRPGPISEPPYVLAVARNLNEQGLDVLEEIASSIPVRVVGGAHVPGTEALGIVGDAEFARLYAGARFSMAPVVSELFGYSVAESLACGTPVLAFNCGGPAEQIRHGENGWLASSPSEFVGQARRLFVDGYPASMRSAAVASSERFGLAAGAAALLHHLADAEVPRG